MLIWTIVLLTTLTTNNGALVDLKEVAAELATRQKQIEQTLVVSQLDVDSDVNSKYSCVVAEWALGKSELRLTLKQGTKATAFEDLAKLSSAQSIRKAYPQAWAKLWNFDYKANVAFSPSQEAWQIKVINRPNPWKREQPLNWLSKVEPADMSFNQFLQCPGVKLTSSEIDPQNQDILVLSFRFDIAANDNQFGNPLKGSVELHYDQSRHWIVRQHSVFDGLEEKSISYSFSDSGERSQYPTAMKSHFQFTVDGSPKHIDKSYDFRHVFKEHHLPVTAARLPFYGLPDPAITSNSVSTLRIVLWSVALCVFVFVLQGVRRLQS